jgi:hypothetical protein
MDKDKINQYQLQNLKFHQKRKIGESFKNHVSKQDSKSINSVKTSKFPIIYPKFKMIFIKICWAILDIILFRNWR